MDSLPLFPLNTVLFPGMPLGLYIFEERYKLMITECLEEKHPFGVVLISRGQEALGPAAQPHPVGCTAVITEVQKLSGGRMNIVAVGQERFHIDSLHHDRPYLAGDVDTFPLVVADEARAQLAVRRLRPLLDRYLATLNEAGEVKGEPDQLPEDPTAVAYLAAALLQAPPPVKQRLLAVPEAAQLLAELRTIYRRELPFLKLMLSSQEETMQGPFSLN